MISSSSVSRGVLFTQLVGLAALSACGFTGNEPRGEVVADSSIDVAIADAALCATLSKMCVGEDTKLRVCSQTNAYPTDYDCDWGCSSNGEAHCAKLVPAGGYLLPTDLDPSAEPQDVNLGNGDFEINAVTGEIKPGIRAAGPGLISGISFEHRGGKIGIFKFAKLALGTGTIRVTGTNPIALVSLTTMNIGAVIDLQGDCMSRNSGPGGFDGGTQLNDGYGMGAGGLGLGSDNNCYGGGGGGHGGNGGRGGAPLVDNRGGKYGADSLPLLLGGSGGGGGGGGLGGVGGGGGGAIQLIAQRRITITGGINVGGCGGKTGLGCGGGGGAGGSILIEAPVIDFLGSKLAANGGGGAGGGNGTSGERASLSATAASGGNAGSGNAGDGGNGADDGNLNGSSGETRSRCGGGGGGVGRMRFNTLSGTIVTSGTVVFSPAVSTAQAQTTVTKAKAALQ